MEYKYLLLIICYLDSSIVGAASKGVEKILNDDTINPVVALPVGHGEVTQLYPRKPIEEVTEFI